MTSERAAWVQLVVLAISIAAFVFVSYADDAKQRSAYEEGRRAGLADARRAARADEVRQHQAIDRVRHECEEECDDRLVRQRGLLVEQVEECQGELAVSRINERR